MRLHKLFLYVYPASFRREYGDELLEVFRRRRQNTSGALSVFFLWVSEFLDIVLNAVRIHWDILRYDLRFTLRTVSRAPGFALTAMLVTALGIGANTAVFSVVNHVLIRPLPFSDPERLVKLWEKQGAYGRTEVSPPNYRDWQRMSSSFQAMSAYANISMNLVGNGNAERVDGASVAASLFPMLGVKPVIGRLFTSAEDRSGSAGAVLLSYGLWQGRFGGSIDVLGKGIQLDDQVYTVIGVMPANVFFPHRDTQLWLPLQFSGEDSEDRDNNYLYVVARLKRGVSLQNAYAEMSVVAEKLEKEYPQQNAKTGVTVETLRDSVPRQSRMLLAALLGASICVLFIACTNLANLFLVRAMGRRRELTVRAVLGAGRERLVRQLLTESFVFAAAGTLVGVVIASAAVPLLSKLIPTSLPVGQATVMDVRVFAFAALLLAIAVLGFGVLPAMRICSKAGASGLREGARAGLGGRKERLRAALVIGEVAASVILLISAGLLIRALWRIQSVDTGFRSENVLTLQTPLPMSKYEKTAKRAQFYSRVLSEIRALPGVENAAYISFLPMVNRGGLWSVESVDGIPANPGESEPASLRFVTPAFFDTLRIPILRGRDVRDSDTDQTQFVAVVSESFVRRHWPDGNGIGRRFQFGLAQERTIVGIVGDIRVRGLETNSEPQVYLPYRQVADGALQSYAPKSMVIRTSMDREVILPPLQRIIQNADPELPVSDVQTLQDVIDGETAPRRTQISVLGAFAVLSLLLAGIGIHGLLAFAVSQRIPEIGVRIALGARTSEILKMVLHQGLQVAAVGACIGIMLAYAAGRAMEALLAGVRPGDLLTFVIACALALFMTMSGCLVPALRAIRVNPAAVMRAE